MKLGDFFGAIAPYLEGRLPHGEAVRRLYGPEPASPVDAQRLAIYGNFCRVHRFEAVDSLFHACRRAVLARAGEEGWEALVETYFRRHPMRHFELNANASGLPDFLVGYAPEAGLPPWLPELADLEWWEWQTIIAPGEGEAAGGPGPRLASTVELRPYRHDLVGWLDEDASGRAPEPDAREVLVLFWRDRELEMRRENLSPIELLVLKAVNEGLSLDAVSRAGGGKLAALEETLSDLAEAGIVLGL